MDLAKLGAIDCDIHPALPSLESLLPHLEAHWREQVIQRGLHELDSIAYPENSPLTARPDFRPAKGKAGSQIEMVTSQALDPYGSRYAILNCLYGVQLLFSEDMGAGLARALNDWVAKEWLDREPRFRASIVVPMQNPQLAAEEIERLAGDRRFVQVMLLCMDQMPLGKRYYWPIYEAAAKHGLPVCIHAGSSYRNPVTAVGWPSYYTEDYAAQAQGFQTTVTSLICEGVFAKFPELKVVLAESGLTWLPGHLWRLSKFWRGLRFEVPWVKRSPFEIVRDNIRLTLQPVDIPPDQPKMLETIMEHFGSDEMILFSTDYPHWQFDGEEVLPPGLTDAQIRKIAVDNPLATYSRLA